MAAERYVHEVLGAIPSEFRNEKFVFHATDIFGARHYKDHWSQTDRLDVLNKMMAVPLKLDMALAIGVMFRGHLEPSDLSEGLGFTPEQHDHYWAFWHCLAAADQAIRDFGRPTEVATVVAENVEKMQRVLSSVPGIMRKNPIQLDPAGLRRTASDVEAGYLTQRNEWRITRIRQAIHFVDKRGDPLLQIADACAFGIRRYLAKQQFGTEFAEAVLGPGACNKLDDFGPPGGQQAYWPTAAVHRGSLSLVNQFRFSAPYQHG